MLTVTDTFKTEYEIKKSKFISYLTPFNNHKSLLEKLKQEHPKARHFVYAYRYLNEFKQVVENSTDDGEPKGTSGKPTLATLQGKEIINSCIITVRYFGGIKLGTGGIVRGYSDSANLVLQQAKLKPYQELLSFKYILDYNQLQRYEYLANKLNIKIIDKVFGEKVTFEISCEQELKDLFEKEL